MTIPTLEYQGYLGSAEVDFADGLLVGRLLYIRDVVTYQAETPAALEAAFRGAVDGYLASCAELGDTPDTPCKGSFNVRVGPELHRKVALAARASAKSLNDFVCEALAQAVAREEKASAVDRRAPKAAARENPTPAELMARVQGRSPAPIRTTPAEVIRELRDRR